MAVRYRVLALYSVLLALAAGAWLVLWPGAAAFPPAWVAVLCVAACLLVYHLGVPTPRVGLASMERLPQVGLLLTLDAPVAATLSGIAAVLWPLLNRRYRQDSFRVGVLRGVHNAGMIALMLLAAGEVYLALGGEHPLRSIAWDDVLPLAAMALTAQAVNVVLLALYFRLDGRDVRRLIKPIYSVVDLVVVPAGVLAALLFNGASPIAFGLFVAVMGIFLLSFNWLGRALDARGARRQPLVNLALTRTALFGARRIDELAERIRTETATLFRFEEFTFALVDPDARLLDVRLHERHKRRLPAGPRPLDAGLFGSIVERGEPILVVDWADAPESLRRSAEADEGMSGSLIAVPLVADDAVIGILCMRHSRPDTWSDADLHLMQQLAQQVTAAVADARAFEDLENYRRDLEKRVAERTAELERANQEKERLIAALRERSRVLERETQEDPLTGIANRRHFSQRLDDEIQVALSVGQSLTLAVADLDRFKEINDRLGHAVGDEVLKHTARLMRSLCRATDLVARIGGEEFALILPGMAQASALTFCETLRHRIESHDWRSVHPDLKVTVSIGLAQWDGIGRTRDLLQAADARLYRAKHAGRNRVA
jgi:diguanylate cyclase (GGDEF)-like protein